MTARECFRRIAAFKKAERIPNYDMGTTKLCLKQWHNEGLPADTSLTAFFGLEHIEDMQFIVYGPVPGVPGQTPWPGITSHDGKSIFRRDAWGHESESMLGDDYADGAHRMIRPGIRNRADWEALRGHFRADEPTRFPDHWDVDNWAAKVARWKNRDHVLQLRGPSMIGAIKEMMGFAEYCIMLYEDRALIEEIMETQTQLALDILGRAFTEVDFDVFHFWEDIAYCNGPILSPEMFEQIAVPRYKRLTDFAKSLGVEVCSVDSDGDIRKLIPGWLRGGINHIWPMEAAAGMDVVALRKEYGHAFSMRGGIDKFVIARGKEAIDRELDRVFPVVQDGGYIPHLDHQFGFAPFENYCYYMERKKEMLASV